MAQQALFSQPGGRHTPVYFPPHFKGWQGAARRLLAEQIAPDQVWWHEDPDAVIADSSASQLRVPAAFMQAAQSAACVRAPDRWALLYSVLWRIVYQQPHLMQLAGDSQVAKLHAHAKAVRRDIHKMHAFVRFREVAEPGFDTPRYVAWFEPDHHIVEAASPFFRKRFANMRWSILTPERCAHWEGDASGKLWFSDGTHRGAAPAGDQLEEAWRTYYTHIFNPARVKVQAMMSEMPAKYWKNLPEASVIPTLIRDADQRVATMESAVKPEDALQCGPTPEAPRDTLRKSAERETALKRAALEIQACQHCALHAHATQAVFGEGPRDARIMLVGEQPGDQEDLAGRPFVGPAGDLLNRCLNEAGLERSELYITNAVKHFKFTPRGKRRLHQKPTVDEIRACSGWLATEIAHVQPELTVCLGATAAMSLLGPGIKINRDRGQVIEHDDRLYLVTAHPAAILRMGDSPQAAQAHAQLVSDLTTAKQWFSDQIYQSP